MLVLSDTEERKEGHAKRLESQVDELIPINWLFVVFQNSCYIIRGQSSIGD